MAKNSRIKLIFHVILLVMTAVTATLIPSLYFFSNMVEQEQERAAKQGVRGFDHIIEEYKGMATYYAKVFSKQPALVKSVEGKDVDELLRILGQIREDSGVDFITITDERGIVIASTHDSRQGDSLGDLADIKAGLEGRTLATLQPGSVTKLAIRAGAGLKNEQGRTVGVISLGYDATEQTIVDRVKQLFNTEATLFLGDERVSTTIMKDGKQVVGTKLSEAVAETVLRNGKPHQGRADILGTDYMTAYLPIMGADGQPVGVLFAGESLANFLAARNKTIMIVGFIILCILMVVIFVMTNRLHKELEEAQIVLEQTVMSRTAALGESEARYRAVVETQTDCIYRCNPEGELIFVNDAFCLFYNVQKESIIGLSIAILLGSEKMKMLHEPECLLTPANLIETSQMRYVRPDGGVRWIEYVTQVFFDDLGNVTEYQAVGRDVTAPKEAETAISKAREASERASRVMTLAVIGGGIAHEINQPLNSIRILSETGLLLCQRNAPMSNIMQSLQDVSGQVDRIDALVNHLRSFLRTSQRYDYVPCHINDVVDSSLSFVVNQLASRCIKVKKELMPLLPTVNDSFVRFEEVVLNLIMNAMQALDSQELENKEIVIRTWVDDHVNISVSDNGPGIDPEICDQIFEPFFSTKKMGDSMGLGLSIVESIVTSCNGSIKAENKVDGGALIQVSLPENSNE